MKQSVKKITGFAMGATDGEIGKVKEFYFDDESWVVRYLIVDTGNWLFGRVVLISTEAIIATDWNNKIFSVNLTKEQIKNSPDINTDLPVSRQEEIKLQKYYPWVKYWGGGYYGGGGDVLAISPGPVIMGLPRTNLTETETEQEKNADKHLRSTEKVTGYKIKAVDSEIGDVEDFIIDESKWEIDFLLIDTGKWLPGKKVLISPKLIHEIDWETSTAYVETSVAFIKSSPAYDPAQLINVVDLDNLNKHYGELNTNS
ncbi:PRC-barrel domain protein [Chryseotalea sanaruensis]|uniref:PRC-barrel domain protein n=1 Tax=Chryseotalea sanaruensis TaxID=2482724 RepID=A0A401U6N9_9BACT|nr:PRC-barrel domain-containing protein [Chryseotalea sanaruensis]GCC50466.1 PRC-barrel domain protein [Chryseotalea sanaruensis]